FEKQADAAGSYLFSDVVPGMYSIEVTFPGLIGSAVATITAGKTTDANVQLQAEAVKFSIDVSDSPSQISAESVSRDVISDKVLDSAPNRNERLDSALPLIPGVVRGPDGLINMK